MSFFVSLALKLPRSSLQRGIFSSQNRVIVSEPPQFSQTLILTTQHHSPFLFQSRFLLLPDSPGDQTSLAWSPRTRPAY